jgi:FixJ family two-component response regulator
MRRILIIDDDESTCHNLTRLLKRHNFDPECAHSLTEGLVCRRGKKWDLILLDLSLPDSPEPLKTLARSWEFEPILVVVITGADDPVIISELHRLNLAYILKGTTEEGVFEQVLKALESIAPSPEIEKKLVENRQKNLTWSIRIARFKEVAPILGSLTALLMAGLTVGGLIYHEIDKRILHTQKIEKTLEDLTTNQAAQGKKIDSLAAQQKETAEEVATGKLDRAKIFERLNAIGVALEQNRSDLIKRLDRIEDNTRKH